MSINIAKLIERGEDALKKKNFDYAVTVLLEAVSFAPDNRKARELLRKAELRKYERAYPSAFALAVFGLGARLGMFVAGLGKKSNPEAFMMACEKYLRLDPKNKSVNMALGDAAARAGHLHAAIFAYETVTEHHPGDVEALKRLGALLWKAGEIERAHEAYDRAVRLNPRDQEAVKARKNLAAEISLKQTGFETAKSSRDLVKDKEIAGRLEQEQRIFRTEDDLRAQRADLERRVAADPENVELLQDLAEACERLQDWDAAAEALERARKAKPGDPTLEFAAADLEIRRLEARQLELLQAGKEEQARAMDAPLAEARLRALRSKVKAYPTDLNLRFKLGQLLLDQGELDEAIAQFQQTVRDPKFRSESQLRLGQAFGAQGRFDLAIRQLHQALEGQSAATERVKEIRYVLGDLLERKGDRDAAREQFAMIYEADINFRDVAQRLRKLESGPDAGKLSLED